MLDNDLKQQLRGALVSLQNGVELRLCRSPHPDQAELEGMLRDVAGSSEKLRLVESGTTSTVPRFGVARGEERPRIFFRGIPGGHEFSSLALALLYVDGKGKRPDEGVTERIRRIRGPVRLRTYVSLSCEICPDVVQALNLMATIHTDFEHETIDGAVAQEEVGLLGIQGVPTVVAGDRTIHSGKISFLDLLEKLETFFGTETAATQRTDLGRFDVAVIGGGPAGVSAAIYAARKGLKTCLVAERFGGQLAETKGIENMISIPYTEGARLTAQLAEHLSQYPVPIFEHRRVNRISGDAEQRIELASGETLEAAAVIVATGAQWRRLGVPGESEMIGRGVAFCAHCDGPFFAGKRVAVVGGGNSGVEAAIDLAGTAREVILVEYLDRLKADDVLVDRLKSLPNISIVLNARITRIANDGERVTGLAWIDRTTEQPRTADLEGVFIQIGLMPNSQFVRDRIELTPHGEIIVDGQNRTTRPGLYAAGDVTTIPYKQIVTAMGDGAKAALSAFHDLKLKGERHGA